MKKTNTTDLEKLNLKGNVKSVNEFSQVLHVDDAPSIENVKTFNINGFLTNETIYYLGKERSTEEYTYLDGKLKTKVETLLTLNGYKTTYKYAYKENDITVEVFEDDELVESSIKKTDENNNIIYSKDSNLLFNTYCEKTYKYDKNDNLLLVTEDYYNEDGKNYSNTINYEYEDALLIKMQHSNSISNDNVGFTEQYYYNNLNKCTKIKVFKNNELDNKQTKVYNNGLLTEHHFYENEDEIKVIKYDYDQKENIIKQTINEISSVATITTIDTFEIAYYNE
ncbi:hypothetical protein [Winogradskyella sediminis]|uniref:hypothetical protein n=1 Tax=Winogradskyella sediminis TaxID=1382466 RepID=UPI000E237DA5|nr:hypothetical protein [Winogradskyella sediminis]REG84090.1 hypothetical protein C8N41_10812 [Winogradskyella sediminis]